LTEAGEHTDAFTLQYIAGHDTIKTTMRYVHLRAESVSRAFARKRWCGNGLCKEFIKNPYTEICELEGVVANN
jgi:hypothetical protein